MTAYSKSPAKQRRQCFLKIQGSRARSCGGVRFRFTVFSTTLWGINLAGSRADSLPCPAASLGAGAPRRSRGLKAVAGGRCPAPRGCAPWLKIEMERRGHASPAELLRPIHFCSPSSFAGSSGLIANSICSLGAQRLGRSSPSHSSRLFLLPTL